METDGLFTVRRACDEDAAAIVELVRLLARIEGGRSPLDEDGVRMYLEGGGGGILLAESGGSVIGLLSFSIRPDLLHAAPVCRIEELIVGEEHRGRGAGTILLDGLMKELPVDCAEVSAAVMPDNSQALAFYDSHGLSERIILLEKHFLSGE
jgi:ribosomal protein S18 acetylase RimI-like enzyme